MGLEKNQSGTRTCEWKIFFPIKTCWIHGNSSQLNGGKFYISFDHFKILCIICLLLDSSPSPRILFLYTFLGFAIMFTHLHLEGALISVIITIYTSVLDDLVESFISQTTWGFAQATNMFDKGAVINYWGGGVNFGGGLCFFGRPFGGGPQFYGPTFRGGLVQESKLSTVRKIYFFA